MRNAIAVTLAAVLWVAALSTVCRARVDAGAMAEGLARRQMASWTGSAALRETNAEWDFMARAFTAWSMAELALKEPARKPECLRVMDAIIARTLDDERRYGAEHFLMPYGRGKKQSLFVDSEVALMLGLRRMVEEKPAYRPLFAMRVAEMERRMREGPVLSADSYPDECWTFDNANALAAMRLSDVLDGTDHRAFAAAWVRTAREKLVDAQTGMLVSSYRLDGTHLDGPEGSSIWMAAHALSVVDAEFARDQYDRARRELGHSIAGFGVAREWPRSALGRPDIDSGVQLPLVEASPSSSGFALLAAHSFGDAEFEQQLLASVEFAAFPMRDERGLTFAASNAVGDAVLLYALTEGPAWERMAR